MRTLNDNQLTQEHFAVRLARREEQERLRLVAFSREIKATHVSKHTAKKDKLHVKFVREHPKIKFNVLPDHAYRAAGLR